MCIFYAQVLLESGPRRCLSLVCVFGFALALNLKLQLGNNVYVHSLVAKRHGAKADYIRIRT